MNKTKTYYQPVRYIADDKMIDWGNIPEELMTFQAFATKEDCEQWLENSGYDACDYAIVGYSDDDIEGVTIIDEYGDVIETNDEDDVPFTTPELEEKVFFASVPYNDSKAFQGALLAIKNTNTLLYRQLLWQELQECQRKKLR